MLAVGLLGYALSGPIVWMVMLRKNRQNLSTIEEIKKGDVLTTAEIAGIQAAKKTPDLIPLCHPLMISKIDVKTKIIKTGVEVNSEVRCIGQTGVEMEALSAVSVALLTIYDMCKAVDKNMVIEKVYLVEKIKKSATSRKL